MSAAAPGTSITVVLRSFPLGPWSSMRQWFDEVRREISLAGLSQDRVAADLLTALNAAVERQSRALGSPDRGLSTMWDALEAGAAVSDISYVVAPEAAEATGDLAAATQALDQLCRSGILLTLPMSPVDRAFAEWYFGEIQNQVHGSQPLSWADVGRAAP